MRSYFAHPRRDVGGSRGRLKWGKFFTAKSPEEMEQVAMTDPDINQAKTALERLSADPAAQALARERELAEWSYQNSLRLARERGIELGREQGVELGREQGIELGRLATLRHAISGLCQVLGIELTDHHRATLTRSSLDDLQNLHADIVRNRRWPER